MRQTAFKLYHNIFLTVVFLLLMDERSFFGLWFHEIAGLAIVLYSILFIVLSVGAFYSCQTVAFSRKTAMFFNVAFFGEVNSIGGESGRAARGEGGEMGARQAFQREGDRGSRPSRGVGKGRGPGGVISLGKVAAYSVIMAFVVMIIRLLNRLVLKMNRPIEYV